MVNNSTNINKNHLSPQLIEWCQQFHQYQPKSPLTSTQWVMVNNSTNINKNLLWPQLIEWWSTILPISTQITSHLNSLSDGQQFHQYRQKSPLTSTHWVMVNNSTTNINKNHPSIQLIEWWSRIPPISPQITSHFNSLSESQQFHRNQQESPLTLTHWVMVNNSTNINQNHLWLHLIEWCQQFHQYQQKSPLTSTHWMMVNNSTNIN